MQTESQKVRNHKKVIYCKRIGSGALRALQHWLRRSIPQNTHPQSEIRGKISIAIGRRNRALLPLIGALDVGAREGDGVETRGEGGGEGDGVDGGEGVGQPSTPW